MYNPNAYTAGGLLVFFLIKPVAYFVILGFVALIIASICKKVKTYWLPILAWLFFIAGMFDVLAGGYTRYILQPRIQELIRTRALDINTDKESQLTALCPNTVNANIHAMKLLPILNSYLSYLGRQIDGNEFESLMNSLKSFDSIDRKILNLENSIIIAKSLSVHKLTGLMMGDKPLALIDGRLCRIGDTISDCVIVNITSNYVTLQKTSIQYNLRISENHQPLTSPPESYLARYSNSNETEYSSSNTDSPPLSENISNYSPAFDSDSDLCNKTHANIGANTLDHSLLQQIETGSSDDTINSGDKNGHRAYLGQLGGNKFNPNSTRNPFGAGNQFNPNSIKNQFGKYGNRFSPNSPYNPFAIDTPKLYDSQGNYRGKLSSNPYDPDSISNPYGRYGSPFSPDSINNPFGAGNPFSPNNPRNPFGEGLAIYGDD
jgi:hypothetical protein